VAATPTAAIIPAMNFSLSPGFTRLPHHFPTFVLLKGSFSAAFISFI